MRAKLIVPDKAIPWLVFAFVTALLLAFHANRFEVTSDEGIILEAAQRMVEGQRLYLDFFGYMSPGSYWLQAGVFEIAGVSQWSGRLLVILDLGIQCALLWWLVARLASRAAAWATLAIFFLLQTSIPGFLTAQHRWDSGALSLVFAVLIVEAVLSRRRWMWFAAGATIAAATLITPSVGILAVTTLVWCVAVPAIRGNWKAYAGGGAVVASLSVAALAANGILTAFLWQMQWLRENYSNVNVMPYGSIIGGYGHMFENASGLGYVSMANLVLCIAMPAILPVVSLAGWGIVRLTGRWRSLPDGHALVMSFLALCVLTLVISTYPRADVMHLAFVVAIPYAMTAALFYRFWPPSRYLVGYVFLCAAVFGWGFAGSLGSPRSVTTPVGELRVAPGSLDSVERLFATVRPGDSLYVHPYMPILYFLTQTENPTRYSYLAPGMMQTREEADALASLVSNPPEWVLYLELSADEFRRLFPNAVRLNNRFERIEDWIAENYVAVEEPLMVAGYELLRRRGLAH